MCVHTHTHTGSVPLVSYCPVLFVHRGPVLSLAMTSSGEQCFSGGLDSTIQWWNVPSSNVDPYDTHGTEPGRPAVQLLSVSQGQAGPHAPSRTFWTLQVGNRLRSSFTLVQSDPSVLAGSWTGHTDAVWGLVYSGIKNRLLSCSADGTIKLWNPSEKSPCISTYNTTRGRRQRPLQEAAGTTPHSS